MAGPDEPERIEIELTSHAPTSAQPAGVERSDAPAPVVEVGRSKLLVGATMVGLLGLLLGFVVGRAGSGDESAADAPVADTTDPPPTTADGALTSIEPPTVEHALDPPPTTVRSRPATTSIPGPVTGSTVVDPVLQGDDFTLVLLKSRGEVTQIDVATGATTTSRIGQYVPGGQASLISGPDWVLIPDVNGVRASTLLFDDGTSEEIDAIDAWSALHQPGTDRFWMPAERDMPLGELIELDVRGEPTGRTMEITAWPIAVDPAGGIVVQAPNGSYLVEPEGTRRLTSGALIAIGPNTMLTDECDETLTCTYVVTDRTNGDRRELAVTGLPDGVRLQPGGWSPGGVVMSPQGDAVLMTVWPRFGADGPLRGVLDLRTGEFTAIDSSFSESPGVWTPDGRVVLFVSLGSLRGFDLDAAQPVTLFEGIENDVRAVAVLPAR